MTELQIGLIGLGGVVVVAVVAYNTWQEYKHQKLAERVLSDRHSDVLLDAVEYGPDADAEAERQPAAAARTQRFPANAWPQADDDRAAQRLPEQRIEPVFASADEAPEPAIGTMPQPTYTGDRPATARSAPAARTPDVSRIADEGDAREFRDRDPRESRDKPEPAHLLSPVIDYVAAFEAVDPAPAQQILDAQRSALARIRKPISWVGYNERSREWQNIVDDGESEYRSIRVGLQLVDRRGPVNESELSVFHIAMQDLADDLMAVADFPPAQAALDAAATLDDFCASVDIQIGINVISGGQVFLGTKLRALAEAAGMVINSDGRFVRCDDDGNVLYVLVNQETPGFSAEAMKTMSTHGVTFLLDVPRVAHGERVFNQMVELARRFAEVLHGALVDDNRRPLSEGALEPIRRQVGQYQALMAARNLPAGGYLAQRMFS